MEGTRQDFLRPNAGAAGAGRRKFLRAKWIRLNLRRRFADIDIGLATRYAAKPGEPNSVVNADSRFRFFRRTLMVDALSILDWLVQFLVGFIDQIPA